MNGSVTKGEIFHRVIRSLSEKHLLPNSPNHRILIAVSGGQDSLCIASILNNYFKSTSTSCLFSHIAIAHYDHKWTFDQGVAEHVRTFANSQKIPFYLSESNSNPCTNETSARTHRYNALIKTAIQHKFDTIITGHTLSDKVETTLLNLIRGSGLTGLSSLTWKRLLHLESNIQLVRPMLNITRNETETYCKDHNIHYLSDHYNTILSTPRNRVRLELIPYIKSHFNPSFERILGRSSQILRDDAEFIAQQGKSALKSLLMARFQSNSPSQIILIDKSEFNKLHKSIQRSTLRELFIMFQERMPTFNQIESTLLLFRMNDEPNPSRRVALSYPSGGSARLQMKCVQFEFPGCEIPKQNGYRHDAIDQNELNASEVKVSDQDCTRTIVVDETTDKH